MAAATMASSVSFKLTNANARHCAPAGASRASFQNIGFCRPARQQRTGCAPRNSCNPSGNMGMGGAFGPMGFSGRQLTQSDIDNMMRMAEKFWSAGKATDGFGSSMGASPTSTSSEGDMPLAVDVQEEADAFVFTADVPGVARSDVKVQARKEERELVIFGERFAPKSSKNQEEQFRKRIERRFGKFTRTFTLPDNVQLTNITAKFNNGVLIVTVPKIVPKESEVTDVPIEDFLDFDSGRQIDV